MEQGTKPSPFALVHRFVTPSKGGVSEQSRKLHGSCQFPEKLLWIDKRAGTKFFFSPARFVTPPKAGSHNKKVLPAFEIPPLAE